LYKSYQQNKADKNDAKRLIIKMLLERKDVRIDCNSEEAGATFEKFISEITKYDQTKSLDMKISLAQFETVRFIRSKQIDHASSGTLFSIFSFGKKSTPPELIFIDTIISHLQKGHALTEQLKDPEVQAGLICYPLLSELIKQLNIQEFQARIAKQEIESEDVTILLAKFEAVRFIRSKQLEHFSSGFFISFFSKNKIQTTPLELVFIDTLISNLQNGISLAEQLSQPEIQADMANYPLLDELIKNETKTVVTQTDDLKELSNYKRFELNGIK
jgi:hypothetical protein